MIEQLKQYKITCDDRIVDDDGKWSDCENSLCLWSTKKSEALRTLPIGWVVTHSGPYNGACTTISCPRHHR